MILDLKGIEIPFKGTLNEYEAAGVAFDLS